ncbi:MAG TPA: dynamin family protein, partial [Pyrinomonadaceae bacterium]|nr:dynamin family protein [Pyrinomonadaceae bacterium]
MSENIEQTIESTNLEEVASQALNSATGNVEELITAPPEGDPILDLSTQLVHYDAGELKNEFLTILDEMTTRLQTGDAAKILGSNLMKKFRQAENCIRAKLNGDFKLVVMGDFKRGKSTLVNALLKMNVATTNVTPETVTINEIEWGEDLAAQACLTNGARVALGVNQLEADTLLPFVEKLEEQDKGVDHIEIKAPIDWLRGVQLVDTPGMGDILNRFDRQVQEYLQRADAIIFLVSALSPLSETEENFLRLSLKPADFNRLIFVVNM